MKNLTSCALAMSATLFLGFLIATSILFVLSPTFPNLFRHVLIQLGVVFTPYLGLSIGAAYGVRGKTVRFAKEERLRSRFALLVAASYSAVIVGLVTIFAIGRINAPTLMELLRLVGSGLGLPTSTIITYYFVTAQRG